MPTAKLQADFTQSAIDTDKGIITGVKIMELGKLAQFAGADGKPKSVTIATSHIKRLLDFAGNRSIPSHLTHEWFDARGKENADSVEMSARVGAFKQFRKDSGGSLVADYYLKPGDHRDSILWGAENNPEDNMVSVVFSYDKNDPLCLPLDFEAADLVPTGAATTALFSETQNKPMDIQELITLLDDPKAKDAIKAIVKSHQDATDPADDATAAEMEKDAGVTDDDKKKEDDQKPALMRAPIRCTRALVRQIKSLAKDETAILAKAKVDAEASATALLGKGKFIKEGDANPAADEYTAALTEYRKTAPSDTVAAMRLLKDKPHLFNAHNEATAARCAKLASK